jgi:hypothetical protein
MEFLPGRLAGDRLSGDCQQQAVMPVGATANAAASSTEEIGLMKQRVWASLTDTNPTDAGYQGAMSPPKISERYTNWRWWRGRKKTLISIETFLRNI